MTYDKITVARDQGLATLTLNAPDKLNAVSRKMIGELKDCWEKLAADSSVRAVLLTGAGRGFCAGADLADPDRNQGVAADSGAALDKFFNPVIRLMRSMPKPIVATWMRSFGGTSCNGVVPCVRARSTVGTAAVTPAAALRKSRRDDRFVIASSQRV